jgi:tetratricopeptide (TPR) repeat protein
MAFVGGGMNSIQQAMSYYDEAMKRPIAFLALLLFVPAAFACFQTTLTRLDGKKYKVNDSYEAEEGVEALRRIMRINRKADGAKMEAKFRDQKDFDSRNDYALGLMFQERSKEAIELLHALEKEKPDQYIIAANLGTSYELAGNNEEALRWITEGLRRNTNSHQGTEWIHVKILQAKIARQKEPDYFKHHSVLDLHPEKVGPVITIDGRQFAATNVARAIAYQLEERMQFVKPPDAPVASLLFDYAAIEAATGFLENARNILQLAVEYGYPEDQARPLLKLYDDRIGTHKRVKSD